MEDKLRLNTNFFGFDGIIGRRDFFLNMLYIAAINSCFILPYIWCISSNAETLDDFLRLNYLFTTVPILVKAWAVIGLIGVCTLSLSNIIRRLNDICGEINKPVTVIISALFIISSFAVIYSLIFFFVFSLINIILKIVLLFTPGKITSKYPYDYRKIFNWGAFLGTWLWGLYNRSYIPLWTFLLSLTPFSFIFKLYCGAKGNEWAFKNKKYNDIEEFNKSQKNQTIFFIIFNFIIMPIIWIILVFFIVAIIFCITSAFIPDKSNASQPADTSFELKMLSIEKTLASIYFERYEITENENKFYVSPNEWRNLIYTEKIDYMNKASKIAAAERRIQYKKAHSGEYKYFSNSDEITRTKIYSFTTGELLGEFISDNNENMSVKDIFKSAINSFRFYNPK